MKRLPNGMTIKQAKDWERACQWAARYCQAKFQKKWSDDSIAHQYMAARNGYLAGYLGGFRAGKREVTVGASK